MKSFKVKWNKGMWTLTTEVFGIQIRSSAKTVGRARFNLQRMYDERVEYVNTRMNGGWIS